MHPLLYKGMPNEHKHRDSIKYLQQLLQKKGFNLSVDGYFGSGTDKIVKAFQEMTPGLDTDGMVGTGTWSVLKGEPNFFKDYSSLSVPTTDYFLEDDEYYKEIVEKDTVYLHHTAGGGNAYFVIQSWEHDTNSRGDSLKVGTSFTIARKSRSRNPKFNCAEGEIFRAFDEKYWAHHLGTKFSNNWALNKKSIGIELCSYGGLRKNKHGDYTTIYGNVIDENEVYDHGKEWKGYRYWHKYSDKQLESLKHLLIALRDKFGLQYQDSFDESFFDYRQEPIDGKPGIWTHVNVRKDKLDCFPQPELLKILNEL